MRKALTRQAVKHFVADEQTLAIAKLAILMGVALLALYVVGLAQYPAVHEAFHDVRHAAGFPCH